MLRALSASSPTSTQSQFAFWGCTHQGRKMYPLFLHAKGAQSKSQPGSWEVCLGHPPEGLMGEPWANPLSCSSFPADWSWGTYFLSQQQSLHHPQGCQEAPCTGIGNIGKSREGTMQERGTVGSPRESGIQVMPTQAPPLPCATLFVTPTNFWCPTP